MKEVIIIGGANGSGKTTFSELLIETTGYFFLNADEIEKTLPNQDKETAKIQAGRILFNRIEELVLKGESFILESTLAGNYLIKLIEKLKKQGYVVSIVYVFLESSDLCIERIKQRVRLGGHHIPDEDVIRRFHRSKKRFWHTYKNMADKWVMYLNGDEGIKKIAVGISDKFQVEDDNFFQPFIASISP